MTINVISKIREFIENQSNAKLAILLTFAFLIMAFSNEFLSFCLIFFVALPIVLMKCYIMFIKIEQRKPTPKAKPPVQNAPAQNAPTQNAPVQNSRSAQNYLLPSVQFYPQPVPILFPYYEPEPIRKERIPREKANQKEKGPKSPKTNASKSHQTETKGEPIKSPLEVTTQQNSNKQEKVGDRKHLTSNKRPLIEQLSTPIEIKEDPFHADEEIVIE